MVVLGGSAVSYERGTPVDWEDAVRDYERSSDPNLRFKPLDEKLSYFTKFPKTLNPKRSSRHCGGLGRGGARQRARAQPPIQAALQTSPPELLYTFSRICFTNPKFPKKNTEP